LSGTTSAARSGVRVIPRLGLRPLATSTGRSACT
jgi:hypothetical protein